MELEGETVLLGGNLNFSLVSEKTTIVNSIPIAFTIANLPILVATLAFNIWAIFIINKKETSRINRFDIARSTVYYNKHCQMHSGPMLLSP